MEQQEGKKNRISNVAAAALLVSAVFADALTLIPIVGVFVGPAYWILANIYFWKSGLGFVNNGRLITSGISSIAEIFPVIQELPTITVGIIGIILTTRIEDKTGISVSSLAPGPHLNSGGMRRASAPQQPLNQGGTRAPNGGLPLK